MSLYNLICGVNPATFYILPMLGKTPEQYPRFRDCFIAKDGQHIEILTRTGGNNRKEYSSQIETLRCMPTYVSDEDNTSDNTFAWFTFGIPPFWEGDFKCLKSGIYEFISSTYQEKLKRIFPNRYEKFVQAFDLKIPEMIRKDFFQQMYRRYNTVGEYINEKMSQPQVLNEQRQILSKIAEKITRGGSSMYAIIDGEDWTERGANAIKLMGPDQKEIEFKDELNL